MLCPSLSTVPVHGARGEGLIDAEIQSAEFQRDVHVAETHVLTVDLGRIDGVPDIIGHHAAKSGVPFRKHIGAGVFHHHLVAVLVYALERAEVGVFRHEDVLTVRIGLERVLVGLLIREVREHGLAVLDAR